MQKSKLLQQIFAPLTFLVFGLVLIKWHHTQNGPTLFQGRLLFLLWATNFLLTLSYCLSKVPRTTYNRLLIVFREDYKIIGLIIVIALLSRLFLISQYPYVKLGDEVRDAGLNGWRLKEGLTTDVFGWGPYQASTYFVPLVSTLFSFLAGRSPLNYLIPSALVGTASILLTYLTARFVWGKRVAIAAAIFLTTSLVHLHYSRTELLVILDALLSPLVILVTLSMLSLWPTGFFLAGLIYGLVLHFYAAQRGILLISLAFVLLFYLQKIFFHFIRNETMLALLDLKRFGLGILLFCSGLVIGIGPSLNYFVKDYQFLRPGTEKVVLQQLVFQEKGLLEKVGFLYQQYKKAFSVYIFEPNNDPHFAYHKPLLETPLNWFFIIGLFYLALYSIFRKRNKTSQLLLFNIFLFPILSQVIINQIGMDHRLLPILPLINIVAALGLVRFLEKLSIKCTKLVLSFILTGLLVFWLNFYFINRPSDLNGQEKGLQNYTFQQITNFIQDYPDPDTVYFILNNFPFDYTPLHYREKIEFLFGAKKEIKIANKEEFLDAFLTRGLVNQGSVFILINPLPELTSHPIQKISINCNKEGWLPNYQCPLNFTGEYGFFFLTT